MRVRHEEGDLSGLEEWVPTRTLLCRWGDRRSFLRDEQREDDLRRVSEAARDPVVEDAISNVLTATGEETGFIRSWTTDPEKAKRLWRRAGIEGDPTAEPHAYLDRFGNLHLTYASALKFAMAFAAAEPEPCLLYLREWEERLRAEGYEPGSQHSHQLIREWAPAHALVRDWASRSEAALLREEVERLRRVAEMAISALEAAGAPDRAAKIRRALNGR